MSLSKLSVYECLRVYLQGFTNHIFILLYWQDLTTMFSSKGSNRSGFQSPYYM
jgi:hypothetical protein